MAEDYKKHIVDSNKNYVPPHRGKALRAYTIRFSSIKKTVPKNNATKRKKVEISFPAYVKSHSDKFTPRWTSEKVFNRPGPLEVFQGTSREIDLEFDVPVGSDKEGREVFCKLSELVRMSFYPSWDSFPYERKDRDNLSGFEFTIPKTGYNMKSAPIISMKFMNFVNRSDTGAFSAFANGLQGRMKDLTFTPNMDAGVIPDYATGKGYRLYPVSFTVKLSFVVHHTHDLGFASSVDMQQTYRNEKILDKMNRRYKKSHFWPREGFEKFPYGKSRTRKIKQNPPKLFRSLEDVMASVSLATFLPSYLPNSSNDSRNLAQIQAEQDAADKAARDALAEEKAKKDRFRVKDTSRPDLSVTERLERAAAIIGGASQEDSTIALPFTSEACMWWHNADDGCPD